MREVWASRFGLGSPAAVALCLVLVMIPLPVWSDQASSVVVETAPGQEAPVPLSTVLLVRHAEKATAPPQDPPLTAIGRCRAAALAQMLAGAGITRIYSTDTLRTRDTAAVVARQLGLEVEVLPPSDLEAMVRALSGHPGEVVLGVGHSNTLGPLVQGLGAPSLRAIADDDYDGLYVVTRAGSGATASASVFELHQPPPALGADAGCER